MATKSRAANTSTRLGTQLRGQVAEAYQARGHGNSALWMVYSPKSDKDVVQRSDLEYGHFLLAEGDPDVHHVDYTPARRVTTLAGEGFATVVDAEVTHRNGHVVWREVKTSADLKTGEAMRANLQIAIQLRAAGMVAAGHAVFTEKEIFANPQRILNWHRAVAWLTQARDWGLQDYRNEAAALLNARRRVTLEEVAAIGETAQAALYVAAVFKDLQRGRYSSDMDTTPLSPRTSIWLEEGR